MAPADTPNTRLRYDSVTSAVWLAIYRNYELLIRQSSIHEESSKEI